jgi:hypothetical protein
VNAEPVSRPLSTGASFISRSVDNLVLVPLFAETSEPYTRVMVATIAVVSTGWFGPALTSTGRAPGATLSPVA